MVNLSTRSTSFNVKILRRLHKSKFDWLSLTYEILLISWYKILVFK